MSCEYFATIQASMLHKAILATFARYAAAGQSCSICSYRVGDQRITAIG